MKRCIKFKLTFIVILFCIIFLQILVFNQNHATSYLLKSFGIDWSFDLWSHSLEENRPPLFFKNRFLSLKNCVYCSRTCCSYFFFFITFPYIWIVAQVSFYGFPAAVLMWSKTCHEVFQYSLLFEMDLSIDNEIYVEI